VCACACFFFYVNAVDFSGANHYKSNWSTQYTMYEGWNFNSGNYLFTTDTK